MFQSFFCKKYLIMIEQFNVIAKQRYGWVVLAFILCNSVKSAFIQVKGV